MDDVELICVDRFFFILHPLCWICVLFVLFNVQQNMTKRTQNKAEKKLWIVNEKRNAISDSHTHTHDERMDN